MRRVPSAASLAMLALTFGAGFARLPAAAQDAVIAQREGRSMSDILVSPATVDTEKPAALTLDLSRSRISSQSRLELSVKPESVSPDETYVIVVSPADNPADQLGSFSFFPPPRIGEVRKFVVDVPKISASKHGRENTKLSIELVPVNKSDKIANSSVRIVGARVVGN